MSYRRQSDIHTPYGSHIKSGLTDTTSVKSLDYCAGRDKLVLWVVSNCGKMREEYVKKLQKYITVSVGGGCDSRFNNRINCSKGSVESFKRFKLYLAFENSYCDD